ncbi:MAG: L,D-transpeptidase family protein [Actinobacteria bacterium]|nr:L,D-transpeptidase family protein [Actinomycetota bacterium]
MRIFRRLGIFLLALLAAATPFGVAAPSAGRFSRVPAGVSVGELPVGGFTSEEARALVRARLAAPVEFELGARTWTATPDELGVSASVDDAIAAALAGRTGDAVEVEATPSRPDLLRYLTRLAATLARSPADAHLAGLDARLRPRVAPALTGRRLDLRATAAAIGAAVRTAQREPVRPVLRVVVPAKRRIGAVIVIRRESKGLYLYDGRRLVRRLGVATGQSRYPTPLGTFVIADKQYNPWWYPPSSDWAKGLKPVPPGPGNPLGTRWMGLTGGLVGIHGTPDAASIGYSASHGCIRMRIPDAEWLFEHVKLGTPVVIVSA